MKSEQHKEPDELKYQSGTLGLFRYATKKDVVLIVIGIISAITHGISFPILAYVFGQMTDAFITAALMIQNHTMDATTTAEFSLYLSDYSINFLYIAIMVLIAAFIQTLCWELSCERQVYRLRQVAFAQILRQDIPWYDTRHQSTLSNLLSDDVERIREGLGCKFSMVLQYVSTFLCGTSVGLLVNWRLTALLFLLAPILIATTAYLARLTAGSAAREQLKYSMAGGVAEEVLTALRTVAAFGMERKEAQRYERALEVGRRLAMRKYYLLAWGLVLVFFVMYAQYAVAFYYGSLLVNDGSCTPGSVFTVFFSVLAGAFTLGNALPYLNSVATALGSASSVFSIIDRVPTIDSSSSEGIKPLFLRGNIKFNDVVFCYPSRSDIKVLNGLTLDIMPGQVVAIVGSSGAGKSTVANLLLRLYDPTTGTVTMDGVPLQQLNLSWLRSQVGVVSQEPVLFGVSIAENIRYGRDGVSQQEIEVAAAIADAHSFIQDLPNGYATVLGERGAQLSGGQKQRIAIARAMVRDPALLVLDEATSALDGESEAGVKAALAGAMQGRTTVIIAHRLSTVRHAHVIYTLHAGQVVERGTHDQLMASRGLYYRLVHAEDTFHAAQPPADHDLHISQAAVVPVERYYFFPFNWLSSIVLHQESFSDAAAAVSRVQLSSQVSVHHQQNLFPEGEVQEVSMGALIKLNKPECGCIVFGVLGSCISGAIMPVFAFFYGEIFSVLMEKGDKLMRAAALWSAMFVVLAVFAAVGIWLEVVFMTLAVEKLVMRLRVMAFHNILRQPIGWFDLPEHSSGRLITRLAREAPLIKGAAGLRLGQLLGSMVTLTAALTIAFVFGWKLALVLMLIVPLIVASAYQQTAMLRRTQVRDATSMDSAGRVAMECVQNIRTVQTLGAEAILVRLYVDHLNLPFRDGMKQAVMFSLMFGLSQAAIYMMYAAAFYFGAYLISIGDMTPSQVYRVFFALAFCAASVGTSAAYVQDYNKAKTAASQLFRFINRRSEIDPLSPQGLTPVIEGSVRFQNVYFHYPGRPDVQVLGGLSLAVSSGQTLAVVGQSGCGKSTILALMERFYSPTSGTITVDGVDISEMSVVHLRWHIGLVSQEPFLFNRSIRDNISYGLDTGLAEVVTAATIANCHTFISQLPQGYDTRVGEGGSQLSGGQKQRIAIARALVRDPRILLLDEATSALDTASERCVQEALERARRGRTCIVIAHRLSTVEKADVIAVVADGRVSELGTHRQLMDRKGLYWHLANALHQ